MVELSISLSCFPRALSIPHLPPLPGAPWSRLRTHQLAYPSPHRLAFPPHFVLLFSSAHLPNTMPRSARTQRAAPDGERLAGADQTEGTSPSKREPAGLPASQSRTHETNLTQAAPQTAASTADSAADDPSGDSGSLAHYFGYSSPTEPYSRINSFVLELYKLAMEPTFTSIIWGRDPGTVIIRDDIRTAPEFKKLASSGKWSTFTRKLYHYQFRKRLDGDGWTEYVHAYFIKNRPDLLLKIARTTPSSARTRQQPAPAPAEPGTSGSAAPNAVVTTQTGAGTGFVAPSYVPRCLPAPPTGRELVGAMGTGGNLALAVPDPHNIQVITDGFHCVQDQVSEMIKSFSMSQQTLSELAKFVHEINRDFHHFRSKLEDLSREQQVLRDSYTQFNRALLTLYHQLKADQRTLPPGSAPLLQRLLQASSPHRLLEPPPDAEPVTSLSGTSTLSGSDGSGGLAAPSSGPVQPISLSADGPPTSTQAVPSVESGVSKRAPPVLTPQQAAPREVVPTGQITIDEITPLPSPQHSDPASSVSTSPPPG